MNYNDFLENIKILAQGQGYYCRLLRQLEELNGEELEKFKAHIEKQNFKDILDIMLYFES